MHLSTPHRLETSEYQALWLVISFSFTTMIKIVFYLFIKLIKTKNTISGW